MTPELHRPVALDRIGPQGVEVLVEAEPEELRRLAERMRLPGIAELRCRFRLRRIGDETVEALGTLHARVTQVCVVTLDEFEDTVEEDFTIRFVPDGMEDADPEPDAVDELAYAGGAVDLGEAAAEQLALALDPYPRKPGVELPEEAPEPDANPFAVLAARRARQ